MKATLVKAKDDLEETKREINFVMRKNDDFEMWETFIEFTDKFCDVSYCGDGHEKAVFMVCFIQYIAHPAIQLKNYAVIDSMMNSLVSELSTNTKMWRLFKEHF